MVRCLDFTRFGFNVGCTVASYRLHGKSPTVRSSLHFPNSTSARDLNLDAPFAQLAHQSCTNIGALIIGIEFWGPVYNNCFKEHEKSIGNYLGAYGKP